MKRLLVPAILAALVVAAPALAFFAKIDPVATLSADGRHVLVGGPLTCPEGATFRLRVSVTQRASGAYAEAIKTFACTGTAQHWSASARRTGGERFSAGAVEVCALGRTFAGGRVTDAHQWCAKKPITLR